MANILVSLVSDQTVPNILMIRELPDIERYLFVSTTRMEEEGKTACIVGAAGLPAEKCKTIVVVEDSMTDVMQKLLQLDFSSDDRFFVNLTGGTKVMSIGLYNFFSQKMNEIYYVPIGKNTYRKIFPDVKRREFTLHYRVGLVEYLEGYGIEIKNKRGADDLVRPPEKTTLFFNGYLELSNDELRAPNTLRKYRKEKKISVDKVEGLAGFLEKTGFAPRNEGVVEKDEIRYLSGDWFEEYVYAEIKDRMGLNSDQIAIDINIVRKNVENQFDVMFTSGNALYVVECKTVIFDMNTKRNILSDSAYKLAAAIGDFGLRVKSFLLTLSNRGEEKKDVRELELDRCRLLNVDVVDRTAIVNEFDQVLSKIAR